MNTHLQMQNGRSDWAIPLPPPPTSTEYRVSLPWTATSTAFPVEGRPGVSTSPTYLHFQLVHRHVEDTLIILNKGMVFHYWRGQCGMFVTRETLVAGNLGNEFFRRGGNRNYRRIATIFIQIVTGTEFRAQDQVLEKVKTFKYLDRMLLSE